MTSEDLKNRKQIIQGLELTYQKLIKQKIERNLDFVVSRNGKVVHLDPKEFLHH